MCEIVDNSTLLVNIHVNKENIDSDLWSLASLGILDPQRRKKISRNFEEEEIIFFANGTDGESRHIRVKVQNGEVIRAVQNLYPLELSSTEELPSKFNQNCRCKNISPEQTPFDDAPVKSDGTIPEDIKWEGYEKNQITKLGRRVRILRRLDL
ncbi:hypothetical protein AVEN_239989-1 [Araneus ventricosus]|uniref:DUF5641 domain-containing protein n=1 Tax=Araneus ventricosus TaxID=182803 RepID=A0A4Y2JSM9_ARAVE|nr:hypothetical protein AVEN_239989-1 [Araneus ventricosus]